MKTKIFALMMLASLGLNAQETMHPSPAQTKKIVISGGTLHIGNGQVIENGTLSIEKGKIKIELSKDIDPTKITLEEAKKRIEAKKPTKKKTKAKAKPKAKPKATSKKK